MSNVFTFPGQGSQSIGMGKELADAYPSSRAIFEEVNEALGQDLSAIMWEGKEDELTATANAQPALMAVSLAAMRALEAEGVTLSEHAAFVAGHSLGEYSALAAADAVSVSDAAKLLRIRGNAMQEAVPSGEGAMAAIIGLEPDDLAAVLEEASSLGVCEFANDNGGGQMVISGAKAAIEKACDLAKGNGAKRALLLPVSAPFHCSLMQPAADAMQEALADTTFYEPVVPVLSNVTVAPLKDVDHIKEALVAQVTGQVRWRESIEWFAENGVQTLYEIGAGKVLSGLARRIDRSLNASPLNTPDDIRGAARALSGAPAPEQLP